MNLTIYATLDQAVWTRQHSRFVVALGVTWLLDGLEGSLGGSLAGVLKTGNGLSLSDGQLGLSSSIYLLGAILGALVLGHLADRFGRRKIFSWTLAGYLLATSATGLSTSMAAFTLCRFLTGFGLGGEYAAVNSAIDELVPARLRGRVDLAVNGTFWLGIALGALICRALLSAHWIPESVAWRLAFLSGLPIGLVIIVLRRSVPESPRWLALHGRLSEARDSTSLITGNFQIEMPKWPQRGEESQSSVLRLLIGPYRPRAIICLTLMASQALLYNSVFFSLTLVLIRYYGVRSEKVGDVFLPIAFANFLGPILLGTLFDTVGRKSMIGGSFVGSGLILLVCGALFQLQLLTITGQIALWTMLFFVSSAAASSAYLSASELFPQAIRGSAIAIFYAAGTLLGGLSGPLLFGHIIGSGSRPFLAAAYDVGAIAMALAGFVQLKWGISAERQPLEALVLHNPTD